MFGLFNRLTGRIVGSFWALLFGVILLFVAVVVVFNNEGRENLSRLANISSAPEVAKIDELIHVEGAVTTKEEIGDEYISPGPYVALSRMVEVYSWTEKVDVVKEQHEDGTFTDKKNYRYEKKWVDRAPESSMFSVPEGHENIGTVISNSGASVDELFVGEFSVNAQRAKLPAQKILPLTDEVLRASAIPLRVSEQYLFIGVGSLERPEIGDTRLSYRAIALPADGLIYGALGERKAVVPYVSEDIDFYRLFIDTTPEEAISRLSQEYTASRWAFRFFGFLLLWLAAHLLMAPFRALVSFVPFVGSVIRRLSGLVSFLLGLGLLFVTMFAAFVWGNAYIFGGILAICIAIVAIVTTHFASGKKEPN
ncbi:MAG: TMEM43 family protein [bacterium]|nr:TMEM43 family protein [bacterium]